MSTISSFTFNAREGRQTHQHSHGHIIIVLTQTFLYPLSGSGTPADAPSDRLRPSRSPP